MKRLIVLVALCSASPAFADAQDLIDESNEHEWYADEALEEGDANAGSWSERACTEYKDAADEYIKASELMIEAGNQDPSIQGWVMGRVEEIQARAELAVSGAEQECDSAYGDGDASDSDYDDSDYDDGEYYDDY